MSSHTDRRKLDFTPALFESIAAMETALFDDALHFGSSRQHDKHEVMRRIAGAGVPCSAILDTRDLFEDPHLRERGFIETVEHAQHGAVELLGSPIRLSASSVAMRAAPLLGQHTAEVVKEDLDLDADEIDALRVAGAIEFNR